MPGLSRACRSRTARLTALTIGTTLFLVAARAFAANDDADAIKAARKERLPLTGGGALLPTAKSVGATELMGKEIPFNQREDDGSQTKAAASSLAASQSASGPVNDKPPRSAHNFSIRDFPNVSEDEPTVVANPKNPNLLVAGTHFIGDTANRCVAHYSSDGGKTWNPRPIFMPQLTKDSQCSDPVLAWAPDGSRVYYAYIDLKFSHYDILVSYSDDNGRSWTGPVVALALPSNDYDKPWIGTHVPVANGDDGDRDGHGNGNWVYVTATRFPFFTPDCSIDFTRSSDRGQSWSAPQQLDVGYCFGSSGPSTRTQVVQGSRPAGGRGGDVVVAWYHSGFDGWLFGTFQIRTRYSADNGATFGPVVFSANDASELPYYLGPAFAYHRWWGGMFPDLAMAPDGSAHLAYTHDPVVGTATPEDGDIRYVTSAGPPYASWTLPVTVNDGAEGKAQGWATMAATSTKDGRPLVYLMWEDHRNSSQDNLEYDIYWTSKVGTQGFSANQKLTDVKSVSDFFFLGDYFDLTVVNRGRDEPFVYGVWTDRRHVVDPVTPRNGVFRYDDNVWGARLSARDRDDDDRD